MKRKPIKWSTEMAEAARERQENGETVKQIAADIGCSESALWKALARYAPREKRLHKSVNRKWTSEVVFNCQVRLLTGESAADVAADMGVSMSALRHGLHTYTPPTAEYSDTKLSARQRRRDLMYEAMALLLRKGWPIEDLAEAAGYTGQAKTLKSAIRRFLRRCERDTDLSVEVSQQEATACRSSVLRRVRLHGPQRMAELFDALPFSHRMLRAEVANLVQAGELHIIREAHRSGRGRPRRLYGIPGTHRESLSNAEMVEDYLRRYPGAWPSDMAQELGLHRSTVESHLHMLRGAGRAESLTGPNRRKLWRLT